MPVSRTRRLSGFILPCLPCPAATPPALGRWLHEIKVDGYRLVARRDVAGIRLLTRHGTDWSTRFPLVYSAVSKLRCTTCLIDGEIVSPDENGIPSFERLRHQQPALLYAFDLVELDGRDLRKKPIEARKAALAKLLGNAKGTGITYAEHVEGDAAEIFAHSCKLGYEGIVSKRIGSFYHSGRSTDWIKIKNPESAAVRRERQIKRR